MGTFPSFPLASLGNGVAAAICFANAHLNGDVTRLRLNHLPARVIGDDFVTWDSGLADHYKVLMQRLGVDIQPSKCMESQYVAEMCSKIITDLGVFPQKKLETLASAESLQSFKSQLEYYGPDLIESLAQYDPAFAERVKVLYQIPQPYGMGPIVSEKDYGILNSFWQALGIVHEVASVNQEPLNGRDLQILGQRKQAYPKDLTFEISAKVHEDPIAISSLQESIETSILLLYKKLMEPELNLEERDELSQVILGYGNMLRHLTTDYDLHLRRTRVQYHLEDPRMEHHRQLEDRDQLEKLADISVATSHLQKGGYEDGHIP
jgi:hypothetical protein